MVDNQAWAIGINEGGNVKSGHVLVTDSFVGHFVIARSMFEVDGCPNMLDHFQLP